MQTKPKNWGDILKLNAEIQKQREDIEVHLDKQRKARFREELDALVEERKNQQLNSKKNNHELVQARLDYEHFKNQVKANPHAFAGAYSGNGMTDSRMKSESGAWGKTPEKAIKSEIFSHVWQSQSENKPKFSEESLRQAQTNKDSFYSSKMYGFETMRRHEEELHEQEKARFEKMKRDEEVFAMKQLQNERIRQENSNYLQNQIRNKREYDHKLRHQELHSDNQNLIHAIRDQDNAYYIREKLQEKQKMQNLEALNKQLEELKGRKKTHDDMLTPLEETINKNDLDFLDKKVQPDVFTVAPSLVPGRHLTYDKKLQDAYLTRSFRYANTERDSGRVSSTGLPDPRSSYPSRTQRNQLSYASPTTQTDQRQLYTENRVQQGARSVDLQYQRDTAPTATMEDSVSTLQAKPTSRRNQNRGLPMQMPNEEYGSPERPLKPIPTGSPDINAKTRLVQHPGDQYGTSKSVHDLRAGFNEFNYISNKNGIHSSRINIITNELKPSANPHRNPFSVY